MNSADDRTERQRKLRSVQSAEHALRDAYRAMSSAKIQGHTPLEAASKSAAQKKGIAIETLVLGAIEEKWRSAVSDTAITPLGLDFAVEYLAILRLRLKDGGSDAVDDVDLDHVRLRAWLDLWATTLIRGATGRGHPLYTTEEGQEFFHHVFMKADAAYNWAQKQQSALGDLANKCRSIVIRRLDSYSSVHLPYHFKHADAWHIGWALMVLAWLLSDVVGESIPCGANRFCTFPEAQQARTLFEDTLSVLCPRCGADITPPTNIRTLSSTKFEVIAANCDSCELTIQFPQQALPESLWHGPALSLKKAGVPDQVADEEAPTADALLLDLAQAPWAHAEMRRLRDLLVRAYDRVNLAKYLAMSAGVDVARWNDQQAPEPAWNSLLEATMAQQKLRALLEMVLSDAHVRAYHDELRGFLDLRIRTK